MKIVDSICLNEQYSTTRLVTKEKPSIEKNPDDKFETVLFLPPVENRKGEGGLRTQGYFKTSLPDKPLITVITVVFNGAEHLEATILSVINQSYDNVEYMIIDGGSNDGTLDIVKKYEGSIDYWVSEPDKGIYDAMNKGILTTTGLCINFMNCGDIFFAVNTLNTIFSNCSYQGGFVIYGNHEVRYRKKQRIVQGGRINNLWKGSQFNHQSTFTTAYLLKENLFNTKYSISADFFLFYTLSKQKGIHFIFIDQVISSISSKGVSDSERIRTTTEFWKIVDKNIFVNIFYIYRIFIEIVKDNVKKFISHFQGFSLL